MASDAVGLERISRVVGYKISKGDFRNSTPNLPQRIAILGEANTANQATLDTNPRQITSAQEAGQRYGYGSPIYQIMRILRPLSGGGIGGIPTVVYPQDEAVGATAAARTVTPTGTATGNATHTLFVAGRSGLDGSFYDFVVEEGDTPADISAKITDAVNAVLGSPVIAATNAAPDNSELTCKWAGLTSEDLTVTVDTNDKAVGITYAVASSATGAGTPSIAGALAAFGDEWNTIVINSYGAVTAVMSALEAFNGIPDPVSPTGRFNGIIMKPFIALTGSLVDDPTSITDGRKEDVTIAICPAPNSDGFAFEAAANMALLFGRISQDTPHLDVAGRLYPDMPTPTSIGSMASYENRDAFVKKGSSTVSLTAGRYKVEDFVTTYHPDGEVPPQFRYSRNLMLDFNVRYGYFILEQSNVVDHAIANNDDVVSASRVVKPKSWTQILNKYAEDLANRALIVDVPFMQDSIEVNISTTNPDRLETFFRYKRSGFARISSTTAEAGFNFGNIE